MIRSIYRVKSFCLDYEDSINDKTFWSKLNDLYQLSLCFFGFHSYELERAEEYCEDEDRERRDCNISLSLSFCCINCGKTLSATGTDVIC